MIPVVLGAAVLLVPERWLDGAALALVVLAPRLGVVLVAAAAIWARRRERDGVGEVAFVRALAAEVRRGASLPLALEAAAGRVPGLDLGHAVRLAGAGRPMDEVAAVLRARLPATGPLLAAALAVGSTTGGRLAPAFEVMAETAAESARVRREVATAAAPARFAVALIGGGPIVGVSVLAFSGHLTALLAGAAGRFVVVTGLVLVVTGAAVAAAIGRGANR